MNLGKYVDVRRWKDRAQESIWRLTPEHTIPFEELTWPLDRQDLARVLIRWPRTYEWEFRKYLGDHLLSGLRRFVAVEEIDLPQPYAGVINFEFVFDGRTHRVNIETSDYAPLNEEAYENCDLHFKQQYAIEGYGERDRLLPGNFMTGDPAIYRYLPRLRRMRDEASPRYQVGGRFHLNMAERGGPIAMLQKSRAFEFYGGKGKVPFIRYTQETARTQVCINLPSTANLTFRIFDYFAIGSCVVGPPHTCRLPVPFEDGVHLAYCREDYSDLVDVCVHYLEHPEAQRRLVENSREFFDRYMHRDQVAAYQLHHCIARFK